VNAAVLRLPIQIGHVKKSAKFRLAIRVLFGYNVRDEFGHSENLSAGRAACQPGGDAEISPANAVIAASFTGRRKKNSKNGAFGDILGHSR
jgi:hypothetical protein